MSEKKREMSESVRANNMITEMKKNTRRKYKVLKGKI